ncbi:MAG: HAD family hydrolase [Candidatus Hermodarchaeota archaeon]
MVSQTELFKIDTIIFDFDGTLHNGETLSLPIFHKCLHALYNEFKMAQKFPSNDTILSQFGKQADDIYPSLLKTTEPKIIKTFEKCVEEAEVKAFKEGKGELYHDVERTLINLRKRGFKLALCTNARIDYFEAAIERFSLNKYFDLMIAAGQHPGKNKTWMVRKILETLESKHFAVVGDRSHDIEAAKNNGGLAIGCEYGFGQKEVKKANIQISHFKELLTIFQR